MDVFRCSPAKLFAATVVAVAVVFRDTAAAAAVEEEEEDFVLRVSSFGIGSMSVLTILFMLLLAESSTLTFGNEEMLTTTADSLITPLAS